MVFHPEPYTNIFKFQHVLHLLILHPHLMRIFILQGINNKKKAGNRKQMEIDLYISSRRNTKHFLPANPLRLVVTI